MLISELIFVAPGDVREGDVVLHGDARNKVAAYYRTARALLQMPIGVAITQQRVMRYRHYRRLLHLTGNEASSLLVLTKADGKRARQIMGRDLKKGGPNFRRTVAVQRPVP